MQQQLEIIRRHYTHIANNVELFLGSPYLEEYLNHILNDSRDGTRQGLPKEVSDAVYELLRLTRRERGDVARHGFVLGMARTNSKRWTSSDTNEEAS